MANDHNKRYGYTTATPKYIEEAMQLMEKQFNNVVFIVCSEDPDWCERNLIAENRTVLLAKRHTDVVDLALLSACDHVIMTVGTFGWWAGFLSGGQVVYFKDFPAPHSSLARAFSKDKKDYFLSEWIGLS
jgi:galactoside 2-L-fucosyltransferase 1/2